MNKVELSKIVNKIFIRYGLSKSYAKISTEALINAELVGAHSHGLSRLKMYCDRIKKNVINSNPKIKHKALKMCINSAMDLAKERGAKLIYTITKEEALQKRYVKYHDMVLTESNVKTFLRDLDGSYSKDLTWISDDEQIESRNK